jgi:hypothetical protein
MPGGGSPLGRRTNRPILHPAFLALPATLLYADMRELRAETLLLENAFFAYCNDDCSP